jgi:hypothetical protein
MTNLQYITTINPQEQDFLDNPFETLAELECFRILSSGEIIRPSDWAAQLVAFSAGYPVRSYDPCIYFRKI